MSKISELLHDQSSGGSVVPEHWTLKGILNDIGSELKHQGAMGATELAKAVLQEHDGFVLYGRQGKEDQGHGLPQEATKQAEMDGPSL